MKTRLTLGIIALSFMAIVPAATPGGNSLTARVLGKARDVLFNYVAWETDAINQKFLQSGANTAAYLTDPQGAHYAHDYLQIVRDWQATSVQIDKMSASMPAQQPHAASAELRATRDHQLKTEQQRQPLPHSTIDPETASA